MSAAPQRPERLLSFRSGGWVLWLAGLLCLAVVVWRVSTYWRLGSRAVGDGVSVDSYRFALDPLLVPRDLLVAGGISKDGIPAVSNQPSMTLDELDAFAAEIKQRRRKFLVSDDLVIGVTIDGRSRAYAVRMLNWHEVINDTLAGRPIAVTYNPLCDSAVVFDRSVAGETLEFGVSGLLFNSNLVMYDRRPGGVGESLWSQLLFKAIAGPAAAAGRTLAVLPSEVVRWDDWRARHPQGTVLAPLRDRLKTYERPYGGYFSSDEIKFPVDPLPPAVGRAYKAPMLGVCVGGRWRGLAIEEIARQASAAGEWETAIEGRSVRLHYGERPPTARVETVDGAEIPSVRAFWFAWYAMHEALRPPAP